MRVHSDFAMSLSGRLRFGKTKLICFFSKKGGVMESRVAILLVCKVSRDTHRAEEGLTRAEPGVGSGGKDIGARPVLTARWI